MKRNVAGGAILSPVTAVMLLISVTTAAGEKAAVYGGDLAPEGRQELAQLFGVDQSAKTDTVTTQELAGALEGTGIPVAPTDKAISSAAVTCLEKGEGLTVRTQNITRMTSSVYANALVTAGVGDATILVAAPAANPVTGETALVGVLKAFPQCQAGKPPEPARVRLAYEQLAQTVALAGEGGDLGKASTVLLKAAQPVVTREARDDAAIGAALDAAATGENLTIPPAKRGELIAFLNKLGGTDYGTYAQGYEIQQLAQNEVKVTPSGAGAPGAGAAAAAAGAAAKAPANAPAAGAPAAAGAGAGRTFSGEVRQAGEGLTVQAEGRDQKVAAAPNLVVTRDGRPAALSDVQTGDRVTVTTNPDGTAQRIDATSVADAGPDWGKWLLALLLGLALLSFLLFLLGRRRRDSFILERATRTGPVTATERTTVATGRDRDGRRDS